MALTNTELNGSTQAMYFQWTLLCMALYAFVYFITMMTSGAKRFKVFTKDFME